MTIGTDGLVYASGERGLFEFDGQTWRNLAPGQGNFGAVLKDDAGRLYVGGSRKLLRFEASASGGWVAEDILEPLGLLRTGSSTYFFAQRNPVDRSLWFSSINRLVRVDEQGPLSVIHEGGLARHIPWEGKLLVRTTDTRAILGWAKEGQIEALEPGAAAELDGIVAAASSTATETMELRTREFRRFAGLQPIEPWRPVPALEPGDMIVCALKLDDDRLLLGAQRGQAIVLPQTAGTSRRGLRQMGWPAAASGPSAGTRKGASGWRPAVDWLGSRSILGKG